MEYEINFLVLQANTESLEKIKEKVQKMIETHKGAVTDTLEYKKRKLAYQINHEFYGFYTVYRFTIEDSSDIETLKKELNLFTDVARYMIVKTDELSPLQREKEVPKQEKPVPIKEKKVIKQEDVEKILAEKKTDSTSEEKPVKKEVLKEKTAVKEETEEETKEIDKEITEKTPEKKEEKKEDQKDEDSLEDLDKKLDEILNI